MAAPIELTAVFTPVENGWVQAQLVEWPAVVTCAPTEAEARDMLGDALREMLLSYAADDELPPLPADARRERLELRIA